MSAFLNLHFLFLSWLIHNMKHYLLFLFILPLLLLALPEEYSSKGSSPSSGVIGAVQTGAGLPDAVLTAADHRGDLHTEVSSGCRNKANKAKKACKKRKCLKHHKEDSSPSGGVPASVCSISLFAVLSQPEDIRFSAPVALANHQEFHTVILLSPDLEQDPHPPRFS